MTLKECRNQLNYVFLLSDQTTPLEKGTKQFLKKRTPIIQEVGHPRPRAACINKGCISSQYTVLGYFKNENINKSIAPLRRHLSCTFTASSIVYLYGVHHSPHVAVPVKIFSFYLLRKRSIQAFLTQNERLDGSLQLLLNLAVTAPGFPA